MKGLANRVRGNNNALLTTFLIIFVLFSGAFPLIRSYAGNQITQPFVTQCPLVPANALYFSGFENCSPDLGNLNAGLGNNIAMISPCGSTGTFTGSFLRFQNPVPFQGSFAEIENSGPSNVACPSTPDVFFEVNFTAPSSAPISSLPCNGFSGTNGLLYKDNILQGIVPVSTPLTTTYQCATTLEMAYYNFGDTPTGSTGITIIQYKYWGFTNPSLGIRGLISNPAVQEDSTSKICLVLGSNCKALSVGWHVIDLQDVIQLGVSCPTATSCGPASGTLAGACGTSNTNALGCTALVLYLDGKFASAFQTSIITCCGGGFTCSSAANGQGTGTSFTQTGTSSSCTVTQAVGAYDFGMISQPNAFTNFRQGFDAVGVYNGQVINQAGQISGSTIGTATSGCLGGAFPGPTTSIPAQTISGSNTYFYIFNSQTFLVNNITSVSFNSIKVTTPASQTNNPGIMLVGFYMTPRAGAIVIDQSNPLNLVFQSSTSFPANMANHTFTFNMTMPVAGQIVAWSVLTSTDIQLSGASSIFGGLSVNGQVYEVPNTNQLPLAITNSQWINGQTNAGIPISSIALAACWSGVIGTQGGTNSVGTNYLNCGPALFLSCLLIYGEGLGFTSGVWGFLLTFVLLVVVNLLAFIFFGKEYSIAISTILSVLVLIAAYRVGYFSVLLFIPIVVFILALTALRLLSIVGRL